MVKDGKGFKMKGAIDESAPPCIQLYGYIDKKKDCNLEWDTNNLSPTQRAALVLYLINKLSDEAFVELLAVVKKEKPST